MFINAAILLLSGGLSPFGYGIGYLLAGFALPATFLIILGLQWRGMVITGYGIEQTGHIMAIGAWLINITLLAVAGSYLGMPVSIIFMVAHAARAYRLWRESAHIKYVMEQKAAMAGDSQ